MYMWAIPPSSSAYAVGEGSARVIAAGRKPKNSTATSKLSKIASRPSTSASSSNSPMPSQPPPALNRQLLANTTDLFEPAVDGPPSPESIRALSKLMRRSSVLEKHNSQQATSSGSSSLRSLASGDRPSWENAMEGTTLSRKSSGRSTTSSMPSRDRPESVQIFGRKIFNRRGKLRRENSAPGSSGSSLHSPEGNNEAVLPLTSVPSKESAVPALFGRRKGTRSESTDESAARTRLQISGPYNFQHVTHTQREQLSDMRHTSQMASVPEASQIWAMQAAGATQRGMPADDFNFANFSSEALPIQEDAELSMHAEPFPRIRQDMPPPTLKKKQASPRRLIKHTKSQEQMRQPPPRPPRSPIEPEYHQTSPPVPPPRGSSRLSTRKDSVDSLASPDFERPQTSGGFYRYPRPFAFSPDTTSPPSTSHGFVPRSNLEAFQGNYPPRVTTPPDDANWPLPNPSGILYEAPLPGVPEEEENTIIARRSRASVTSNTSSLRGSHSVPMLRKLSLSQGSETKRPSSGASDTLGRFDLFAAQRALRAAMNEGSGAEQVSRESWEDDIDYCYDHAAEADCDYAWERPSLDAAREDESVTPVEGVRGDENFRSGVSPSMLTPGQFDVPALSPASQNSVATAQDAITPTVQATPKASNFSLPRAEPAPTQRYLHVRKPSDASSFKESHGFNLSPSLLIPNDYRQQMLASEFGEAQDHEETSVRLPYESPTLTMDTSTLLVHSRISASTTMSTETDPSGSDRHVSTTSASTAFTRLTMSTSSLDMETYIPKPEPVETPAQFDELDYFHVRAKSQGTMPILPETEATLDEVMIRRDVSHGSDPDLTKLASVGEARSAIKRKDQLLTRRRARTTSLSTPPPPGQYALFPSVHITGPRI